GVGGRGWDCDGAGRGGGWQRRAPHQDKAAGGDMVARLYALRQATAGEFDFDRVARECGKRALRQRHAPLPEPKPALTETMLEEMVSWPLDLLGQVVRAQMN